MEWYKRYTNRSNHGQMYEAGFWGGVVFDALCDSSAAYDLNGRLPKVYGGIDYLRRQLRLSEADFCGECKPSRNVTDAKNDVVTHENGFVTHENHVVTVLFQALKRLISVGLVHEEDGFYVIDGWERKQRKSPKSDAERSRNYRENKKQKKQTEAENETVETVTKRHVQESDANVRVTERHARVDKSREEKNRIEKNREKTLVANATGEETKKPKKTKKPVDPEYSVRRESLLTALIASYEQKRGSKYLHQGVKDEKALKRLIGLYDDRLILQRWELGLVLPKWPGVSTIAQLGARFNELGQPQPVNQQLTTQRRSQFQPSLAVDMSTWDYSKENFE